MSLFEAFLRNPVKVAVGVLLVALFGAIALLNMPVQLTPEVQVPVIAVETRWPGASPQEVEREIVQEQEEQLKAVEGMTKMTSESYESVGEISLEFPVGTDLSEALVKVISRLQQVPEYPEDAEEPLISTSDLADRAIAWFTVIPRLPTAEQIEQFERDHPELVDDLKAFREARTSVIKLQCLRDLAEQHPKVKSLAPLDLQVPKMRKFVEDEIEARFERVDGVARSDVYGGEEEEMQVVVDPQRLAARRLTINDVRLALRGQNKDTSGGDFSEGKRKYVVRTRGQYRSPEQVADTIVARRNGLPVYVRDVGQVRHGHKKPEGIVRRFGTPNIALNCQREPGANVLEVMAGLRQAIDELNAGVLKNRGVEVEQVYDETVYIDSAIGLVEQNIVVGGTLTVLVLLLFLRSGRSTLVIALAIPTSIIGTFLVLRLLGRSLNVISLAGLAFAVGMLVDNAVVVLENIYRHYQRGESSFQASVRGAKEVWGAVLASTLTTLAVFIPVLFVAEEAGQLFRDIALAISSAVALSLVVSVSVIPTAAGKILRRGSAGREKRSAAEPPTSGDGEPPKSDDVRSRLDRATAESHHGLVSRLTAAPLRPVDWLARGFVELVVGVNAWLQRSVLLRLTVVAVLAGGAVLLTIAMVPDVEYLPEGNRNLVFARLLPPPGYNIDQMTEIGKEIEGKLQPYFETDPGTPEAEKLRYPVVEDFFYVSRPRFMFMGMRCSDPLRAGELVPLAQEIGRDIPGMITLAQQSSLFARGPNAGRSIDIEITGRELERLVELGRRIMGQVQEQIPGCQAFPRPSLDLSSPEVHVVPKWEQAADMGLTATDLGYTVDALVDGAYATDYYLGGDKIDLSILGQEQFASRLQQLDSLPIAVPTGELVPLAAVAEVKLASGPTQINHSERQRAITIQVTPPPAVPLSAALSTIEQNIVGPMIESGELGEFDHIFLSGTVDQLRETWAALRWNIIIALVITYLLMAALFESWLYPLVIMVSVPMAAVGGFAGLRVVNLFTLQQLDVLTMLGFVILIGTVVNNAILIVHQSLNHIRDEGMPAQQAILRSVRIRIRPIFMTTFTTTFGLLPLVVFPGAGSELYRGLGSVVLGGLLASTVFTLILVPTLFSLVMQARDWLAERLLRQVAAATAAAKPEEPVPVS